MLNLLFNHDLVFRLIGLLNRRLGFIQAVFLAYPANDAYRKAYTYPWRARLMNWKPGVSGLFRQNGKFGIMFTVSNCDSQFIDPGNQERLRTLLQRMEKIRQLFGARQKTFAGILPGIFSGAAWSEKFRNQK